MTKFNDVATLDYHDFKIVVNRITKATKDFKNQYMQILNKYARKERMVEKGTLSKEAGLKLEQQKKEDLARLYADLVIVDWDYKQNEKKIPFNKDNVVKVLSDPENDDLFADIIEQSALASNFIAEEIKEEQKN